MTEQTGKSGRRRGAIWTAVAVILLEAVAAAFLLPATWQQVAALRALESERREAQQRDGSDLDDLEASCHVLAERLTQAQSAVSASVQTFASPDEPARIMDTLERCAQQFSVELTVTEDVGTVADYGKDWPYEIETRHVQAHGGLGDLLEMLYCIGQLDTPGLVLYNVVVSAQESGLSMDVTIYSAPNGISGPDTEPPNQIPVDPFVSSANQLASVLHTHR